MQGQIIAANSYQMTLLTGEYGKAAEKLYVIAAIYIAATLVWWLLYRRVKALYVVSLPFAVYGLAFFILGMGLYSPSKAGTEWVFNVATGLYAVASASGSLYFVLNFGTEGNPLRLFDNTEIQNADFISQVERRPELGHTEHVSSRAPSSSTWHSYGIGVPP